MVEQRANIGPRDAVRLSDLERWHILTAVCSEGRHRRQMRLWQIMAGRPPHIRLTEVEEKLRCQKCGNREGNRVLVTMAERD